MLGAILVTGFLGGAIAVHFRLGEVGSPPQLVCLLLGTAMWAGLCLLHPPLRSLFAGERPQAQASSLVSAATVAR